VDDEPENAEFLHRMFRKQYDVVVEVTGDDALVRLKAEPFDVIITDQLMPGITGTELLTRSLALAPDAVRILVTGYPDLESAIASINQGRAYRFFTKPLDRKELISAVNNAVEELSSSDVMRERNEWLAQQNQELRERLTQVEQRIDEEVAARAAGLRAEVDRLRAQTPFDEETVLYSRAEMQRRLDEEVARSGRYGLVFALGMLRIRGLAGRSDRAALLGRCAELLRLGLRRFDSCGRWGPDLFCVLMPHTDRRGADACLTRLAEAIRTHEAATTSLLGPGVGGPGDAQGVAIATGSALYPLQASGGAELAVEAERAVERRS
jgi:PleD family two-component response regulator